MRQGADHKAQIVGHRGWVQAMNRRTISLISFSCHSPSMGPSLSITAAGIVGGQTLARLFQSYAYTGVHGQKPRKVTNICCK